MYLPRGPEVWYDFHSMEIYKAGQTIQVAAPLNRLPLLAPAGAMIPVTKCCEPQDFATTHDEPSRCLRYSPACLTPACALTSMSGVVLQNWKSVQLCAG